MRAFALIAALTIAPPALAQAFDTDCRATAEAFNQLRDGMTVAQAEAIIGCPGVVMSETRMSGFTTVMLGWDGNGTPGANMNAMFQNDALLMKAQFGLR